MVQPIFIPQYISPPGDTIADRLDELKWTVKQLAVTMWMTEEHVEQLILGISGIDAVTAYRLSLAIGSTQAFWMKRESQYRKLLASNSI